jgi:hypothetical protein
VDVEAAFGAWAGGECGVVGGDDGADDGQAEPVSTGVVEALGAEPLERLEEAVHLTRRYGLSGVADRQDRASLDGRGGDLHLTAPQVVPEGVVDQVGDQAFGQARIGSMLAGRLILPGHGFAATRGHPLLSLGDGPVLRAAAGSVLYLALIALLSLGVADTAAAIGIVLGLLYLVPIITAAVGEPTWHRHLQQIAPMTAGLTIQNTTGLHNLPIGPWAGVGVLATWTATALLTGGLLLQRRDA